MFTSSRLALLCLWHNHAQTLLWALDMRGAMQIALRNRIPEVGMLAGLLPKQTICVLAPR